MSVAVPVSEQVQQLACSPTPYGWTGGRGVDMAEMLDAVHECPECHRLIPLEGCECAPS